MGKKLTARGNSWILTINKTLIDLIGVQPENDELQFKVKNKVLYIPAIEKNDPQYSKSLIRKFSKKNSSWCLYFPEPLIEVLGINPATDTLEINIDDNIMIIKKSN